MSKLNYFSELPETCNVVKLHPNYHRYYDEDLENFFYWPERVRFDKEEMQDIYKLTPISYVDPTDMPEMDFLNPCKIIYLTRSKLINRFEVATSKKNLNNHPLTDIFL